MGRRTIRVALADDHTMFRQGMAEMLSTDPEIEIVGQAANGSEALELIHSSQPDVLVLDVEMPRMDAYETLQRLGESRYSPKVLIVTMFEDPNLVRELTGLGASAYLVKSASMQELISAVHSAVQDGAGNVTVSLSRGTLQQGRSDCELSERELEVLLLAARGLSNRQVALRLHLSEATVKRHLANVYAKLNVASRGEAARRALSEGWISARDLSRELSC